MPPQDKLLDQLYGLLEDWRAKQYGGETIVDAIERLIAVIGASPTNAELEKIRIALEKLADVAEAPSEAAVEAWRSRTLMDVRTAAGAPAPEAPTTDLAAEARNVVHRNVAELKRRMGWRPDPGNDPIPITAPPSATTTEIVPRTVSPGGDASLYGTGLTAVREIFVGGYPARIRRRMPGEVAFEVPAAAENGDVVVTLADGDPQQLSVDVVPDGSSQYTST